MGAKIFKIGEQPITPSLLLQMVDANINNIESVVISVVADGVQNTYWVAMPNNDLAFHATAVYDDLVGKIKEKV